MMLVVGSGRSGTSLFTKMMNQLGYAIPQPEVPADSANPHGYAEPQWLVDFHQRMLSAAGVHNSDARPDAWRLVDQVSASAQASDQLTAWLADQLSVASRFIVKDPRSAWFLPLWVRSLDRLGADIQFVTMLRNPMEVLASKRRWFDAWEGEGSLLAGWLNVMLHVERVTRGCRRSFVRYADLLGPSPEVAINSVGDQLGIHFPEQSVRAARELIDPALARSNSSAPQDAVPPRLQEQVAEVWTQLSRLAAAGDGATDVLAALDLSTSTYASYYAECESVAAFSIRARDLRYVEPARWRKVARLLRTRLASASSA